MWTFLNPEGETCQLKSPNFCFKVVDLKKKKEEKKESVQKKKPFGFTFWSTMEQTSSLTEDSDTSPGSRVTASLVSPIWSRKEMPWNEPREFVGLGADWLPLESRLQMVAGGLGEGDGVGGAGWWGRAWNDLGEAGRGGGLLSVDIVCYLWRGGGRTTSKVNIQNFKKKNGQQSIVRPITCPNFSALKSCE